MAEYMVRWKFQANTLLNKTDHDTEWIRDFHSSKDAAVSHHISLLKSDVDGIVVETFQLRKVNPQ